MRVRHKLKFLLAASVFAASSMAANAATVGITEGQRALVEGTTKIDDVFLPGGGTYNLGSLDDDTYEIYGRVTRSEDLYAFGFSVSAGAKVSWIFGGYNTADGYKTDTGLTGVDGKEIKISVLDASDTEIFSDNFTADTTTGPATIFDIAAAGSYKLLIDGLGTNGEALYDIRLSAVPLPAGGLLILSGLAGFGLLRRKRNA